MMRRAFYKVALSIALVLLSWPALHGQSARSREVVPPKSLDAPAAAGRYYALVIGNSHYRYFGADGNLVTPINDATEVADLLRVRYGFETELLVDADRDQILTALVNYRRTLAEDANLLIYYAGHGHHDRDVDEAYWLPVDAHPDNNANWISADDITRDIRAMSSLHVLVISDSCYSGYLAGNRAADVRIDPQERHAQLAKLLSSKSRMLMSSGGDEPVTDAGAPGHSFFAAALLDGLRQMPGDTFTGAELFYDYLQPKVAGGSAQVPQYSWILNSGHRYGDFVFTRRSGAPAVTSAVASRPAPTAHIAGWAVTHTGNLLHTEDGQHWVKQKHWEGGFLSKSLEFLNPQVGWVIEQQTRLGDSRLLQTTDGGQTWAQQIDAVRGLHSVTFTTRESGWVVRWADDQKGDVLLHTEDGGRTWVSVLNVRRINNITPLNAQSVWLVGAFGYIAHTEDAGRHWVTQASLVSTALVSSVFVSPREGWVVGDKGVILHTIDGGSQWTKQESGTDWPLSQVSFANAKVGWAVGSAGTILHTEDGGQHWSNQESGTNRELYSLAFINDKSGWVVGTETVLHTENGGATWKRQVSADDLENETIWSLAVFREP